jgi:hypothetical protein
VATDLAAVAKRLPPELRVRVAEDADLERLGYVPEPPTTMYEKRFS